MQVVSRVVELGRLGLGHGRARFLSCLGSGVGLKSLRNHHAGSSTKRFFVALIVCDPETIKAKLTPLYESLAKLNCALKQAQKTPQTSPKRPGTPQNKATDAEKNRPLSWAGVRTSSK